jgi:uracil-DNA glycosylase
MGQQKDSKLANLAKRIIDNKVCAELASQATQLVFGDGSNDADIVFIGEAPGKNEDLQGKPFVGAAGKFLNEMLEMIGLRREEVYITNIVKYRPPNNRDPFPEEKNVFLPYLEEQLVIINPKLIITLGRHSLNCFLPQLSISQVHGQPKRFKWIHEHSGGQHEDGMQGSEEKQANRASGTESESRTKLTQQSASKLTGVSGSAGKQGELMLTLLPLFHPAAALYNGAMRQTLIDDFAKIPAILKQLA